MAFGFMKNYFYGKNGKKDFTEADLPVNRMQLFRDVLKTRWSSLFPLNTLYILIWIPAAIWTVLNLSAILAEANETGVLNPSAYVLTYLLLLFPLIAITGPFNIGASYVLRNWARDEHAFIWGDFKDAIKKNWKQALLYSTIEGAVPLLSVVAIRFYLSQAADSFIFVLPAAILILAVILWKLAAMLIPTMIVTYDLRFGQIMRNAFIMSFATLPRTVLIKLATLAVPALSVAIILLFPSAGSTLVPILLILYTVFMVAFNKLIIASHANAVCEKYLNSRIEGAETNIGLRPEVK